MKESKEAPPTVVLVKKKEEGRIPQYWVDTTKSVPKVTLYVNLTREAERIDLTPQKTYSRSEVAALFRGFRDEVCR